MQNCKKITIVFLIVFLYLISGFLLGIIFVDEVGSGFFIALAIMSFLYYYILIKVFHLINKLFPLKYLAYKNTYIIVLCIFVINLLLTQSYDIFPSGYIRRYLRELPFMYYSNFLFILYILYSIKHYNKYYGTFLSYKTKYSFLFHIVFLFIYCMILSILFYIMFYVYLITALVVI